MLLSIRICVLYFRRPSAYQFNAPSLMRWPDKYRLLVIFTSNRGDLICIISRQASFRQDSVIRVDANYAWDRRLASECYPFLPDCFESLTCASFSVLLHPSASFRAILSTNWLCFCPETWYRVWWLCCKVTLGEFTHWSGYRLLFTATFRIILWKAVMAAFLSFCQQHFVRRIDSI